MPDIKTPSGIDWNYTLEGKGDVLLFIHGWGVDGRIWRQQVKYFAQDYQVMTIDLPGHGKSSWQNLSLELMAQDLTMILSQLGLNEITIIGSSLGGLLALKLYDIFSSNIKRMIFVGSMPKFSKSEDNPYGLDVNNIRKLGEQLESDYPAIINVFFRSLFTKEERSSRRFKWLQKFRKFDGFPMREALESYLAILEKEDLRDVLRKINIPMQFINGTEDTICNRQMISVLKELSPQARFDFFEHCGHFTFLSKSYEFNKVVEDFLSQPKPA